MKKILSMATVLFVLFALAACDGVTFIEPEVDPGVTDPTEETAVKYDLEKDEEVIALSAISSATLAPVLETNVQPVAMPSNATLMSAIVIDNDQGQGEQNRRNHQDVTLEDITPYLSLFEKLLSDSPLTVTAEASDRETFEFKVVYTLTSLVNDDVKITMYYNLTPLTIETPVDETTEETEALPEEYTLEGIVIRDGEEFEVLGLKRIEDGEEIFIFTTMIDELNYVRNAYVLEDGEQKFKISTFVDGVKVSEDAIKLEQTADEVKFFLRSTDGVDVQTYEFKLEDEDGLQVLKVRYDVTIDGVNDRGQARVLVTYDEATGVYAYSILLKSDDDDEEREEHVNREMEDNDEDVAVSDLLPSILDYISVNYPDEIIEEAELDDGFYEVELVSDIKLYFDLTGEFVRVKVREQHEDDDPEVTLDVLPDVILTYVSENYPEIDIKEVKFRDGYFKVELRGGIDLYFDEAGNFVSSNLDDFDEHPGRGRGQTLTEDLIPEAILTYITTTYPEAIIEEAKLKEYGYTIELDINIKLIFDLEGQLIEEKADDDDDDDDREHHEGDFKADELAQVILDYITTNYPDAVITDVDLEDGGFEVELNDSIELLFGFDGTFISEDIDDDDDDMDDEDEVEDIDEEDEADDIDEEDDVDNPENDSDIDPEEPVEEDPTDETTI